MGAKQLWIEFELAFEQQAEIRVGFAGTWPLQQEDIKPKLYWQARICESAYDKYELEWYRASSLRL